MTRAVSVVLSSSSPTNYSNIKVEWSYYSGENGTGSAIPAGSVDHLTNQKLVVDSPNTGAITINLGSTTLRSYEITQKDVNAIVGSSANERYTIRLVAVMASAGSYTNNQLGSNLIANKQFLYRLDAPTASMYGADNQIVIVLDDTLPSLSNQPFYYSGSTVTGFEVTVKSSNDLDTISVPWSDAFLVDGKWRIVVRTVGSITITNTFSYEVSAAYITSAMGTSPSVTDTRVGPTLVPEAVRGLAVTRPTGSNADNSAFQLDFQAPGNDVNPTGSTTMMSYYEAWYKASASTLTSANVSLNSATSEPVGWTKFTADKATDAADNDNSNGSSAYSMNQGSFTEGTRYWFIVRAVRNIAGSTNEEDNIPNINDNLVPGDFCAPVDGLVFNYVNVAAPIFTGFTDQSNTRVTIKLNYPTAYTDSKVAATIFDSSESGSLSANGYRSQFKVTYGYKMQTGGLTSNGSVNGPIYSSTESLTQIGTTSTTTQIDVWVQTFLSSVLDGTYDYIVTAETTEGESAVYAAYGVKAGTYIINANLTNSLVWIGYSFVSDPNGPKIVTADATSGTVLTDAIDFGALGVRRQIVSVTYEQFYKGVAVASNVVSSLSDQLVSTSDDSAHEARITGAVVQTLTTYSAPSQVVGVVSTAVNASSSNAPMSTGKASGNGNLYVTWTNLIQSTAWSYSEFNSDFYSLIKYRVIVKDGNGVAVAASGTEDLPASGVTIGNLDNAVTYNVTVQAYFVNPENSLLHLASDPAVDQEVAGMESANAAGFRTPFYYPDDVIANAIAPTVTSGNLRFTWNIPSGLNGVGSPSGSAEVSLGYVYTLETYTGGDPSATPGEVSTASSNNITFTQGYGYKIIIKPAYVFGGVYYTDPAATAYVIYYAQAKAPVVSFLEPTASGLDGTTTLETGSLIGQYVDGGNPGLTFVKLTRWLQTGGSDVANYGSADSTDALTRTETFDGLTNGSQYVLYANATYSFGGQEWPASSTANSGATGEVLFGIPYGLPIINSVTLNSPVNGQVTFNVNPNGRNIRETLIVGIPVDTDINADIGVKQSQLFNQGGSANNAVSVDITSTSFGYVLKQTLVVAENLAGSDVVLQPTS